MQIFGARYARQREQCKGPEVGAHMACLRNPRRPVWLEQRCAVGMTDWLQDLRGSFRAPGFSFEKDRKMLDGFE